MTRTYSNSEEIIDALEALYEEAVEALSAALARFLKDGTPPDGELRASGAFCYPELVIQYHPDGPPPPISRSFGKFSESGTYVSTITRPDFFRDYLTEQLDLIMGDYAVTVEVRRSTSEMPYTYVWDQAKAAGLEEIAPAELARWFPTPKLEHIGDEVADGDMFEAGEVRPLALFDAPRADFSLKRLEHYTGTRVEDVQKYILFTNYHRYVDAFVDWALEELTKGGRYKSLSVPGGLVVDKNTKDARKKIDASPWRRFQMPAYHLTTEEGDGITLVNIGVGPSNAKTITDHLAVLRPQCWIMVGHCGGLRHSQTIGDYVLAHAYLRDDHVLDSVLAPDIPVPPIAEVQVALAAAAEDVTQERGDALKKRLRTGTVVTTDDRNWELRITETARRFNQSRAIAIDMESATIAANGFRLRVPYGVLLCVSDKPMHGEIKLPGAANRFYERAIGEHIRIGISTLERLAVKSMSIALQADLRRPDERERMPGKWTGAYVITHDGGRETEAPHQRFLQRVEASAEKADNWMNEYYELAPFKPHHQAMFSEWFQRLADLDGPALVNCAAGKDRTGILCALTHHVLGVSEADIMADYELTNIAAKVDERLREATAYFNTLTGKDYEAEVYKPFLGVRGRYLETALGVICDKHGSVDSYLGDALGVDTAMRDKLVTRLVG